MSNVINAIRKWFTSAEPISPGMYHYQAPGNDPRNYRLHLRVEDDGRGVLIVNAATVLHLNETATEYAYYFIQNIAVDQVVRDVTARYHIDPNQVRKDYNDLLDRILTLVEMPDLDPVTFLDFSRQVPYSGHISAPYRLDCALTYKLPPDADPALAPTKNVTRELTTNKWTDILDKAWTAGVPHVIFTGGEATMRDDLIDLIAHAELNGQVSGLLTDGIRLADKEYLQELLQTGLDHLMILLNPDSPACWTAIENAIPEDIYTVVHYTIGAPDPEASKAIINRLADLGVEVVSLSINDPSLKETLEDISKYAASLNLALVWDIPVPYSTSNPISLELLDTEALEGAGRAWLYVEPDGDVLATQGAEGILGNLSRDDWDTVWAKAKRAVLTPA